MKKGLVRLIFYSSFFLLHSSFVTAQQWVWGKQGNATGGQEGATGFSVTTDNGSNVIIAGRYDNPSLTFGSYTLSNNSGNAHIFIAKFDANGNVLWAKSAGGTNNDGPSCVATDANGNVYMAGGYSSPSIVFGKVTLTLPNANNVSNAFLVKYDANGNVLWATCPKADEAGGGGLVIDANGNVYFAGSYYNSVTIFGSDTLINSNGGINGNMFLVKYDKNGNMLWAKNGWGTGGGGSPSNNLAIDVSGNIYVTGCYISKYITFGKDTLINQGYTNGPTSMFVSKYDVNGNVLWAKGFGGSEGAQGECIAVDASGNAYIIGTMGNNRIVFVSDTLNNPKNANFFFLKYDPNGNPLWGKIAGGRGDANGWGVTVDHGGDIHITGIFWYSYITLGSDTIKKDRGYNDIFLAEYSPNGEALSVQKIGGTTPSDVYSIATDANRNIFITGDFGSDSLIFGHDTVSSNGGSVYVAKNSSGSVGINTVRTRINNVGVFPNPNNGVFTIAFSHAELVSASQIEIYNVLGEQVYYATLKQVQGDNSINLSYQPNGVYFYRVTNENGGLIGSGKVIIEH